MTRAARRTVVVVLIATGCAAAAPAHAQRSARDQQEYSQLMSELARLRQAAAYESTGNFTEAEKIVADVLSANPSSLSGLLTMERILTAQGRKSEILPAVNRLLRDDPESVIGHQTRLRVTSDLDDLPALEAAIAEWIRATPRLETPYREAALVWRNRGESSRSIAILEQGRKRIERADALALELGDAYANSNDPRRAAAEWSRAIGEGRGFLLVQRRLQGLPDGGARVIPALVEHLTVQPSTFPRLRAAAVLAIDGALEADALRIIPSITALAPPDELNQLLAELARRADGAGLYAVALRLYRDLLAATPDAGATLALRTRIAELALLAGDTALAAETYRQLESAAAAGSPQRRQAVALRIQLTAREGDLAQAARDYAAFRTEFAQAPELDATAATLGAALLDGGDTAGAERVLTGVSGARSAQLRGLLYLRSGDIDRARNELIGAAPLLRGRDATATIALATLLSRISPRGGELVARVVAAPEPERVDQIRQAATAAATLAAPERAAVLDFLADAAEAAGMTDEAVAIRHEIVETLPRTHEAPAALLALARHAALDPEMNEEARVLLEKLIVDYPRSALAPQARTELQRLQQH